MNKMAVALLAFPSNSLAWLSPRPPELFQLLLHLRVAISLHVARVARRPFLQFGGLARTFRAPDVPAVLADGGCCWDEQRLALVAGAPNALLGGLVDQLVASACRDGQDAPLLGLLHSLFLLFLGQVALLRVAGALLAALVLALRADLLWPVQGAAVVAAAMHTHADRLLDTLDGGHRGWRGDPFVRLESEAVLCEESAGTLLLHCAAVQLLGDGGSRRGVILRSDRNGVCCSSGCSGRGFLFGSLDVGGLLRQRSGRSGFCTGGAALAGLLALENTAHPLHIFAQARLAVPILPLGGR